MVCHRSSPEVTDSAPKETPYSPVATEMDSPTFTAGDWKNFTLSTVAGHAGAVRAQRRPAAVVVVQGMAGRYGRPTTGPARGR